MKDCFLSFVSDGGKTKGNTRMFKLKLTDGVQPFIEDNSHEAYQPLQIPGTEEKPKELKTGWRFYLLLTITFFMVLVLGFTLAYLIRIYRNKKRPPRKKLVKL